MFLLRGRANQRMIENVYFRMTAESKSLLQQSVAGMNERDLEQDPIWRSNELGRPIPGSLHAVSVALPRWQDVVDYEEKTGRIADRIESGYPRFVIHPLVREVAAYIGVDENCLPFPSTRVAEACAQFVRAGGEKAEVLANKTALGVQTTAKGYERLRAFWQHTGLIVSSREAESVLAGRA